MSDIRHMPEVPTHALHLEGGDTIDRHRHDEHQLVYVSTGVLAVTTAHGSWVASADRAVWLPAGVWHEHRFYGASAFHSVGFATGPGAPLDDATPAVVAVSALLRELLVACTDERLAADEHSRIRAVTRDQLRRMRQEPVALPAARDERLAAACRIVAESLDRPWTLAALAGQAGTSERTLSRLFRSEFAMTYPQWRTNLRVLEAMILLAGGASVTATGQRCGWATTSAFIDAFRRAQGRTPRGYQTAAG